MAVYPNPCREQLQLHDLPTALATAEVRDATGRLALRQLVSATQAQLDTKNLAPGLYQLRLLNDQGQVVGQSRFMRE